MKAAASKAWDSVSAISAGAWWNGRSASVSSAGAEAITTAASRADCLSAQVAELG